MFMVIFFFFGLFKGPGCSSIAYGAASELGPLRVGENGEDIHFNNYAWNKGFFIIHTTFLVFGSCF